MKVYLQMFFPVKKLKKKVEDENYFNFKNDI